MAAETMQQWAREVARTLGRPSPGVVRTLATTTDAELTLIDDIVVKLHAPRTDAAQLARRLDLAAASGQFVPPLDTRVRIGPDGRPATIWPLVEVADAASDVQPWAASGALLARLHRVRTPGDLPRHGWPERLDRAAQRAPDELRDLGVRLASEARRDEPPTVLHGDWHLGQLGRWRGGWRLLDVDDVGVGDPAWDLARPAGFWACGLLADADWHTFLDAYRDAGGPAIPPAGDPWPALDLPARCAVFVAAVRAAAGGDVHGSGTASILFEACRRMAQ
ncbi:MAG TPA: aminoglycoside phosphotransferase family protein [Micropruina sp.]|nr:aminoglycoside phosphotransferase family protein [Micropruina sp.]HMR21006.1 aminoglycoside phosphotransferase family protein [Micropruina sp.]